MQYFDNQIANKKKLIIIGFITIIIMFFSLFIGRFNIPILKFIDGFNLNEMEKTVFFQIRLPRILLVMGVGAALSIAGASYQSTFRNPLVSPDILGVSAGASFGAALGMVLSFQSFTSIYLLAFVFGIIAVFLTYFISKLGKTNMIMMMVLSGIVVGSLFNAFISILKYVADPYEKLPGIVFWLMGGFSRTGWDELKFAAPFIIVGIIILILIRWYLNVMSMGEEEAISMGINVKLIRRVMIFFSTLMVASSVATVGQVSWVGLVVPHISRFIVGADHRYMVPASGLLGASFLLIMDDIARSLTGAEIPISIITALLGAPFFAYLLISQKNSGWNR
ncbi:MAG: iron ABC transporter permease [Halanaerobiales bacterium]|nr:iron ABC transporter permease [Halanaerobiales bacterium]